MATMISRVIAEAQATAAGGVRTQLPQRTGKTPGGLGVPVLASVAEVNKAPEAQKKKPQGIGAPVLESLINGAQNTKLGG